MQLIKTDMPDVIIIKPKIFGDNRGFFSEIYRKDLFFGLGLNMEFVQDNHSGSTENVLRGLHFQWDPPMGKLMRVTVGSAFLVAVDIRKGSPTIGRWFGTEISSTNRHQLWAPAGFARGFCVTSDYAEIQYKCTGIYNAECESGIHWNDSEVGIEWPTDNPALSERDIHAQSLSDWLKLPESDNFVYGA